MGTKAAFAVLLIVGALQLRHRGLGPALGPGVLVPVALFGLSGFFIPTLEVLGQVSNPALCVIFAVGGGLLVRGRDGLSWMGFAMLLRSLLFLLATAGFFVTTSLAAQPLSAFLDLVRSLLSAHSFLDTGAEWLLALAGVLALSDRVSLELRQSNRDLLAAQEDLRRLADRDPLTALMNRRALPEVLRRVQPGGALFLFFDLDGFKTLNDRHGHQVGDDCLRRFADGLRECFRPQDALVRYAGDEFLVVAQGLDEAAARDRVEKLRACLAGVPARGPDVPFSAGSALLRPGGRPDEALAAADRSMYVAKAARAVPA
jgi:diguanylate cyclase (GGDEF)-like protein